MSEPLIVITAFGTPAPQGSKNARPIYKGRGEGKVFTGKVAQQESSAKVKPWRDAVRTAAVEATGPACARLGLVEWEVLDGPLVAEFVFTLTRGKTVRREHHTTYPDLSKLIRSTEDALTSAKIWADDARVIRFHDPRKVYVGAADPDALAEPGVVIRIWRAEVAR